MSKLVETKRAFDRVKALLDRELVEKKGVTRHIHDCREAVNIAFYLLGWAQFEYLSRRRAEDLIDGKSKAKNSDGISWRFVQRNIRSFPLKEKLEVIFSSDKPTLDKLHRDYDIRNEAAHNYKKLPSEVSDVSAWLEHLEELVDQFQS